MSTVIRNLVDNPPLDWIAEEISTHSESRIMMLGEWFRAKTKLRSEAKSGRIDLAHIHVTHGLSWYRKRSILRECEKFNIPSVIHIHSGKFEKFCSGKVGKSVKEELGVTGRRTIILEERWRGMLSEWIPENATVVPNPSKPIGDRSGHKIGSPVRLLVLGRKSPVKRHDFCVKILESLHRSGVEAVLKMTGATGMIASGNPELEIRCLGWVDELQKSKLISESDFLLSPSEYEGSSMSVIESMVSGLPCLVSEASRETIGVDDLVMGDNPDNWAEMIMRSIEGGAYEKLVSRILEESKKYSTEENKLIIGEIYNAMSR
jgi:glycosyltransferase involved in cell wall biosynthesis